MLASDSGGKYVRMNPVLAAARRSLAERTVDNDEQLVAALREQLQERLESSWHKLLDAVDKALDQPPDKFNSTVMGTILEILFPEDYAEPANPTSKATEALVGEDRCDVYAQRIVAGQPIYHPGDRRVRSDREAYVGILHSSGNIRHKLVVKGIVKVGDSDFA